MLALFVMSAAAISVTRVESNAHVKVSVLTAVTAAREAWLKSASPHKREILVKEPDGKLTLVRVVEYE